MKGLKKIRAERLVPRPEQSVPNGKPVRLVYCKASYVRSTRGINLAEQ